MRAPRRSLCTFKSLVAPPSLPAQQPLDPRWVGAGEGGPGRGAAQPPERRTGGPRAAWQTRAPGRPSRAVSRCASRRIPSLGFLDLSAVKSPTSLTRPGQGGGREVLPTQCPAQGLAYSRALWTLGEWPDGWVGGKKDGEVAGRLPGFARRRDCSVEGGGATIIVATAAGTRASAASVARLHLCFPLRRWQDRGPALPAPGRFCSARPATVFYPRKQAQLP